MSLLEVIGEVINPGRTGRIDLKSDENEPDNKFIVFRFIVSLFLIGLFEYFFLLNTSYSIGIGYVLKVNTFFVVYLLASYFLTVKPDYDNLGWVPFVINNPFRFSDFQIT